jgi:hypothetical protein
MNKYLSLKEYAKKYKKSLRHLRRLRKAGFVETVKVEDLQEEELKRKFTEQGLEIVVVDKPYIVVNNLKAIQQNFNRGAAMLNEGMAVLRKTLEKFNQILS